MTDEIANWRYNRVTGVAHGFAEGSTTSKCGRMHFTDGDVIKRRHCYLCPECRDLDACHACEGKGTIYNMPDDRDELCWLCKGSGLAHDKAGE